MSLILIAAVGVLAWMSVAGFFLTLCQAAARANQPARVGGSSTSYFNSRDSRRSLSSLPSVWQVGQ
jgi:hypothetical protein